MIRILLLGIAAFFFSVSYSFAQNPKAISLVTYYPSPDGVWDRLRLVPQNPLAGACSVGSFYVRRNDSYMQFCTDIAGVGTWVFVSDLWGVSGTGTRDVFSLTGDYYGNSSRISYVGIGTNDPQGLLHIRRDDPGTPSVLRLQNLNMPSIPYDESNPNAGVAISFRGRRTARQDVFEYTALRGIFEQGDKAHLRFYLQDGQCANIRDCEKFRFTHTSRLGLQDISPDARVEIVGNATQFVANNQPYFMISDQIDNDGSVFMIDASGNVGIKVRVPSQKLEIDADMRASVIDFSSDAQLKSHILPLNGSLEKVAKLSGVIFQWQKDPLGAQTHMGLIAQDVEKVFPELVHGFSGEKSIDYFSLVAPLIEAIKELKKGIDERDLLIQGQQRILTNLHRKLIDKKSRGSIKRMEP